ncbi:unnamed protein product, partial [Ixodes hexagonus]
MSGRGQLFIGRLPLECRERDVEQVFERYGRLLRCDVKYGTGMAYAFVDYEDHRDAEWPVYRCALHGEGGPTLLGDTTEPRLLFPVKRRLRRRDSRAETTGKRERERERDPLARPLCEMRCKPLLVCRSLPVLSDPLSATGTDGLRTLSAALGCHRV